MTAASALQPQGPDVPGRHRIETAPRFSGLKARIHTLNPRSDERQLERTKAKAEKASAAAVKAQAKLTALPTQKVAKPTPPKAELKAVPSTELIDSGKAGFTVDSLGVASKNVARKTASGYSMFARRTGDVLADAYQEPGWFVQLFETAEQRTRRVNVQAVAQVLILTASAAGKLAAHRKGAKK